jgi:lipopolysaccharide/colanic/teichoic acid biosynthesis glycosyltransferase
MLNKELMYQFYKRIIDLVLSLLFILVFLPVLIIISVLIIIESGLPVFYCQERAGRHWKVFKIIKFRTMIKNAEKLGPLITSGDDKRITAVGKFLRKYKLDELPQLLNVVKGDMSLVGPRPELLKYAQMFSDEYSEILSVKPGISDFASIRFRDEAAMLEHKKNVEEIYSNKILPQKIKLYYKYLTEKSLTTDFKIIYSTFLMILR